MTIIRDSQQAAGVARESERVPEVVPEPLRLHATEEFADDVAAGRTPSIRAIRARLHVGQPRAQQVRSYLAGSADG
jgi:hypothetical protein